MNHLEMSLACLAMLDWTLAVFAAGVGILAVTEGEYDNAVLAFLFSVVAFACGLAFLA